MIVAVISTYESDRREPSFRTLIKLIEATGHKLAVELVAAPSDRLGLPDTRLGRRLRRHRRAVIEPAHATGRAQHACLRQCRPGEDTEASDVDLLVDLDEGVGVVSLAGLCRELAELLGVDVDVVPATTLKVGVRDGVMAEAIAL